MKQEASMVGVRAATSPAAVSGQNSGRRVAAPTGDKPAAPSRALVAVTPVTRADLPASIARHATSAAFLAQLIATRAQLPQTRERRRAEPSDAVKVYASMMAAAPQPSGPVVSRAL